MIFDIEIQNRSCGNDDILRLGLPPENLQFTGRQQELQNLSDILKDAGKEQWRVAVLHGLGGIGKTDIVLHYAWHNQAAYSSVVWIAATSIETLKRSFIQVAENLIQHLVGNYRLAHPDYMEIASTLGIHGLINASGQLVYNAESVDQDRIVAAVPRWLATKGNDQWLLIFDNVDDFKVIDKVKHFPQNSSGAIIITSRRRGFAQWGTGSFEVNNMDQKDSLDLLMKRAQLSWNQLGEKGE